MRYLVALRYGQQIYEFVNMMRKRRPISFSTTSNYWLLLSKKVITSGECKFWLSPFNFGS